MSCMLLLALVAPALLLVRVPATDASSEPLRCAPCTEEHLALCPAVAEDCAELAREPGCGCCLMCALREGSSCGVYTARCGQGLACRPRPGELRPLHALTRGQGVCMEAGKVEGTSTAEATDTKDPLGHENTAPESTEISLNYRLMFPGTLDRLDPWNTISAYEQMKAKRLFELKRLKNLQGPCQKELYRAMDKLAKLQQITGDETYRFHLPNCNRNGFYHSKQCEASLDGERGRCWCVYPLNGKRIPGSPELRGDIDCQQYLTAQE
ncbi:insulin-like growth factor-binding protein 1 [Microcaecilia unicolor]|uniref:Insulin-like growth factor-binding protein 1 n=1 Tax=Microcaecilia unicolor TaxID=1415580 RepID=A0A6P7Y2Z1_9AMPH|nr:insulin-like growth factor-binding protein 1 [Microcaecilia unicolor]